MEAQKDIDKSIFIRLRNGSFREEIACALGVLFLVLAVCAGKSSAESWLVNSLYAGAYFFAGIEGLKSAISSLRARILDVDVLMVLAALGAAIIGAPFEGALLLFLFSFSNVLQRYAMAKTNSAISSLLKLRPDQATVIRDGSQVLVPVEKLELGELVIVKPGEQIPVDGKLVEGHTFVDESSLTGESMPVEKSEGSNLFAGTMNQSGGVHILVSKRSEDTALARMVKLVNEAQSEKSKAQRFLENAEQYYAMGVILFTLLVAIFPWLVWGEEFSQAFYRAMTVMVVASPCALIISTPATVLSAIGGAARKGILIKGGSHLDRASTVDIVAIDKTGTLTSGKPSLVEIVFDGSVFEFSDSLQDDPKEMLKIAAALEARSEHPLGRAIISAAEKLKLDIPDATDFKSTTGKGAEATIESRHYIIGSESWFRDSEAEGFSEISALAKPLQEKGYTCVWLGLVDGENVSAKAVFSLADTIRTESKELTSQLHKLGVKKVVMITGDHQLVANRIGAEVGIDEIHAEMLPEDKLEVIRNLKREGCVMMIGDGVNDAPALAMADLSVAMGAAGTDVAMETADVVLMGDRLEYIPLLLNHARRARKVLLQNLIFSAFVIIVLVIGALGFSLPLPIGVIGHEGSTVLVCLNGLRLLMIGRSAI